VLMIEPAPADDSKTLSDESLNTLKVLLAELPLKQAVKLAVEITGEKKNLLYDLALQLKPQN
jgi:16S rRNA (cytidine1402-2'-O)-methyltransferase